MNKVQVTLLEIVKYLDDFCKTEKITYYLMGGSALGAMRHKGFIPWDDDFDVFMDKYNYKKFLSLNHKIDPKFFLQKENTEEWPLFITQLCLNNTTFIDNRWKNNKKQHHGLFVDIMCMYDAPKNLFKRRFQYYFASLLKINALRKIGYSPESYIKGIIISLSRPINNPYLFRFCLRAVNFFSNKSKFYGHYFGAAKFKNTSFPKNIVGKQRFVPFHNLHLPVFERVEKYLEIRYGKEWGKIPSLKVRSKYSNHGDIIDLSKNYNHYLNDN